MSLGALHDMHRTGLRLISLWRGLNRCETHGTDRETRVVKRPEKF